MTQYWRGVEFCSKAKQTSNDAAVPFLCPMKALLILICFGNERGNEPSSGMDGAASSVAATAIPSRSLPVRIRLRPCSGSRSCKELPNFVTLPSVVVWVREKNPMRITVCLSCPMGTKLACPLKCNDSSSYLLGKLLKLNRKSAPALCWNLK